MKTEILDKDTEAVWVVHSRECEILMLVRTGVTIGRIHKSPDTGHWNGFFFKSLARHAVQTDWEMRHATR